MEIAFKTKSMRTLCLNATAIDERYGAKAGAELRRFLADVRAAECLGEVPLMRMSLPPGGFSEDAIVEVSSELRLVVKANHLKPPKLENGQIDWASVDRVLINRIEQTHG